MCIRDRVPCPEERKLEVVEAITKAFDDHECSTVDGVRVRFNNEDGEYVGWYLARKSNTEPVLVMRIEATDEDELTEIRTVVANRVAGLLDIAQLMEA